MDKGSLCLSSSGLKNINKEEKDFIFFFGEREVRMDNLFAEFFSPLVSRLHLSDPTINSFIFNYPTDVKSKLPKFEELISEDIILLIQKLSSGSKVTINEEQNDKLLIISALIDNEELFEELVKLLPKEINQTNLDRFLSQIQIIESFSQMKKTNHFKLKPIIDAISKNFYLIDENKLKELSKPILLSIISNEHLKIKDEDWLFDFIQSIHNDDNDVCDIDFYEQICVPYLSEDKFKQLLLHINPSEMTTTFWKNICSRICDPKLKKDVALNRYAVNQHQQNVIVGGWNKRFQLGKKPNNADIYYDPSIDPPVKMGFDSSLYQSYSIYNEFSVKVTSDGSLLGVGNNTSYQISTSLPKTVNRQFTEFFMKDIDGCQLTPVSALCYRNGTLYMLTKSSGIGRQLILCDSNINDGKDVFLDIGNQEPVALYGGNLYAAVINSEGEVIFINSGSIRNSPSSRIDSISLPEGEKASSVACCDVSIYVLSTSGRVFVSEIENGSCKLNFSAVEELSDHNIVCLSGTHDFCLCVSSEGRVFGRGSNKNGQLGLGEETKSVSSFTEITALFDYGIRAVYAGYGHSLFETREGKILACGSNESGELLLSSGAGNKVYSPMETIITEGATFCIAGVTLSVVFIGDELLPNMPNRRIQQH
ncbi:hypothetical protein M9Y10_026725 [Tritrichomonas musculus]|uniref:Uncharacterized protein n=1 Tax=Tritrichomonas musculus TaxID=1915356 RepID=A0ABR2H7F2_9EUKA